MLDVKELRRQFDLIRKRQPALIGNSDEDVFPVWILLALANATEQEVATAICGGPYDGDMDAIFVDEKTVWIVQGKLRSVPVRQRSRPRRYAISRRSPSISTRILRHPATPSSGDISNATHGGRRKSSAKPRKQSDCATCRSD